MKTNYNINGFADLEREEIRVKRRLKKQEEVIKIKLKTLPEEIVTTGITKIITGILNGDIFKSAVSIVKTVGSVISGNKEGESSLGGGILNVIKKIVKDKLAN
jgi:hypothetical protein